MYDPLAQALDLASSLLEDIELSRSELSAQVLKASRLARLLDDKDAIAWLRFEAMGYDNSALAQQLMAETGRKFTANFGGANKEFVYSESVSGLESARSAEVARSAAASVPSVSGDYALAVTTRAQTIINAATQSATWIGNILGRTRGKLHEFVATQYQSLAYSETQASVFASFQAAVDAQIAPLVVDSVEKVDFILAQLESGNPEATSAAMNTSRRLINATADALFPARDGSYSIAEGNELAVGQNNVLNRLQAACHELGMPKPQRDRLRRTLLDVYDRVSAGVHADVSAAEARALFILTYVTLGEVVTSRGA